MRPLTLATEDELSEAVALRLLADFPAITIGTSLRRGGNGYLRSRMRQFCEIAHHSPVLIVTDLDTHACPAALRMDWLKRLPRPASLLLRVAVCEIEAWLLADHAALGLLFGQSTRRRFPDQPDTLGDPKAFLLDLAMHGPRRVREALCAEPGAVARQGLGYNAQLCDLIRTEWQPDRAAERFPSLRRAIGRVRELAQAR
jgi:hypothetical protein